MHHADVDRLAQRIATRLTRRTGLGLLASAGVPFLGLAEITNAKKKKVTLCLDGQTVKKPKKKAKKLLKQGATKGACDNDCPGGQKSCGANCIPVADCCVSNDCTGTDVCENGDCVPLRCGNGGACTVFLTLAGFTGSQIGGLNGGDAKCQAAADAANLDGDFKAWLAVGNATPKTRFTNVNKAGPYRLVANGFDGGSPPPSVAENFADLFSCGGGACLNNAINRHENGSTEGGNPGVWTGVNADGVASDDTCVEWASNTGNGLIGSGTSTSTSWTDSAIGAACTNANFLYCFQQAT